MAKNHYGKNSYNAQNADNCMDCHDTFQNNESDKTSNRTSNKASNKASNRAKNKAREFDSCIIKIVRAGRIKPVLFLSSFSIYYLVIFSDM